MFVTGLFEILRTLRFSRNVNGVTSRILFVEILRTSTDEANAKEHQEVHGSRIAITSLLVVNAN